jgi:hypothetical protein
MGGLDSRGLGAAAALVAAWTAVAAAIVSAGTVRAEDAPTATADSGVDEHVASGRPARRFFATIEPNYHGPGAGMGLALSRTVLVHAAYWRITQTDMQGDAGFISSLDSSIGMIALQYRHQAERWRFLFIEAGPGFRTYTFEADPTSGAAGAPVKLKVESKDWGLAGFTGVQWFDGSGRAFLGLGPTFFAPFRNDSRTYRQAGAPAAANDLTPTTRGLLDRHAHEFWFELVRAQLGVTF